MLMQAEISFCTLMFLVFSIALLPRLQKVVKDVFVLVK